MGCLFAYKRILKMSGLSSWIWTSKRRKLLSQRCSGPNIEMEQVPWLLCGFPYTKKQHFCLFLRGHHRQAGIERGTAANRTCVLRSEKLQRTRMFSALKINGSYLQIRPLQSTDVWQAGAGLLNCYENKKNGKQSNNNQATSTPNHAIYYANSFL